MSYDQDWDRQLNPFRYKADGTLTDAAKEQNVAMQLNSANGSGASGGAKTSPGSGTGTTRIEEPASLKRAARGASELAGDIKTTGSRAEDSTRTAARALKGDSWNGSLGAAMDHVVETWHSQTAALVSRCRSLHDRCAATADNYTQAETANAQAMGSLRSAESGRFG
ncbi:hypothetical protein [Streptomyces halobius]|uniref:Excreted virulence factor EspC (Type VII ESX diderm) n=1 Tax=Streptomyces halobius TaxID=2879846 RepID=A0ABY4M102_9ACTN|nr:hypothetical protein [Streptomyces halobius]UQA91422.1 hypothetical protein K9S39_05605 [Streptomyces halobius]